MYIMQILHCDCELHSYLRFEMIISWIKTLVIFFKHRKHNDLCILMYADYEYVNPAVKINKIARSVCEIWTLQPTTKKYRSFFLNSTLSSSNLELTHDFTVYYFAGFWHSGSHHMNFCCHGNLPLCHRSMMLSYRRWMGSIWCPGRDRSGPIPWHVLALVFHTAEKKDKWNIYRISKRLC